MYSVDDSKSDWQSYLEENDMPGIQVLGLDGFPGQLSNDYKFSSIPRHLLFDPAGNILGTDLERPSFLLEIRYLDKFLNQTNP